MPDQVQQPRALPRLPLRAAADHGDVERAQRAAVVAEALTWLGTSYHPHGRIKGVGVDCAQILCAVYEACGMVPYVDTGWYSPEWHLHRGEEVYIDWLQRYCRRLPTGAQPQPGDIALYRYGRLYAHGGIVLEGGRVLHAYVARGVIITAAGEEPLADRPVIYWSPW